MQYSKVWSTFVCVSFLKVSYCLDLKYHHDEDKWVKTAFCSFYHYFMVLVPLPPLLLLLLLLYVEYTNVTTTTTGQTVMK